MKGKFLVLVLSFFLTKALGQEKTINYKDFKIDGLLFISTRAEIIRRFGNPLKVFAPNYECGFLSDGQPGGKFYSLQYPLMKFTGNREGYQLEEVQLNTRMKSKITYKGQILSAQTTKAQFEKIFEVKVQGNGIFIRHTNADDALTFSFTNGLLSKIEYWSPC